MSRIQRLLLPKAASPATTLGTLLVPALLLVTALGAASFSLRAAGTHATTSKRDKVVDFEFSQIIVKHQPEAPDYPTDAKAQRIQGIVVVALTIGTDGKVTSAKALSGPQELQACAVNYAKAWEFEPAKSNGKAVPARFKLTMPFRLR